MDAVFAFKNSNISTQNDTEGILKLKAKIKEILENPNHEETSITNFLNTLTNIDAVLAFLRKGTNTENCSWDPAVLPDMTIGYMDDVPFLTNLAYLVVIDLINQKHYDQAIALWNDAILLSRRITFGGHLVCNLKGNALEQTGIKIISQHMVKCKLLDQMQLKQIQVYWQNLPDSQSIHKSVLSDLSLSIDRMKKYPILAFLEFGFESPVGHEYFRDVAIPIKVGEHKYSLADWIGAIHCFFTIDYNSIEKTIFECVDCVALPYESFEMAFRAFMLKMHNTEYSYEKDIFFAILPAIEAGKYEENRTNTLRTFFQRELINKISRCKKLQSSYGCVQK